MKLTLEIHIDGDAYWDDAGRQAVRIIERAARVVEGMVGTYGSFPEIRDGDVVARLEVSRD